MSPISRRRFVHASALAATAGLASGALPARGAARRAAGETAESLPNGPAPAPVSTPHFPSRLHAFVWRNWSLVPVDRLAAVVGARAADIRALGTSMGLGSPPPVPTELERRGYITVIKRNWHLLPYAQLLALLGWSASELAYTLREDDFLWIKLGSLKPKCEPLRWEAQDPAATTRAAKIAEVIAAEFGGTLPAPREPLFSFVRALSRRGPGRRASKPAPPGGLRFCYSYFALYGDPLLERSLDSFPDGYLERLADAGVNGVWLQGVLYRLAPFPWQPALSDRFEERLRNLGRLVERAARHGIRVFLYLNEPRAMPRAFFDEHPELKGVAEGDHAALCTSTEPVRRYLRDSIAGICRAVPGLGGFLTITASENFTNCWSHGTGRGCPRCAGVSPAQVVSGVNEVFQGGIDDAGHGQTLIAWDWGWNDAWAAEAIAALPSRVALQSVSEWALPIDRGGVKTTVGEYSISSIGPGPRATRHWELARQRGLRAIAKIQANNTWELSALPYLPVLANVAEHARRLREQHLDGVMLGWTLGGYPSPNLETIATVMAGGTLEDVANRRFGRELAPAVVEAWTAFSVAFREFPFDGGVVYSAPLQNGPSNLLWPERTGYGATMVGFPYDHLDGWRGPYPAEVFIGQLEKVAQAFELASARLSDILATFPAGNATRKAAASTEAELGRAAAIHFRSVANQCRFIRARDRLRGEKDAVKRKALIVELERLIRDELRLAKELFEIQSRDSRIGFEASNHYYYVPADLAEKVVNCRWLLESWVPQREHEKAV